MFTETAPKTHLSAAFGAILLAYYLTPYLYDPHDYRRRFSGPWLAAFTGWWLSKLTETGHHSETIKSLHDKHGKFVRIGPNHISIADPDALEAVYGHGSGLPKSEFYKAHSVGEPGIFSVQDRAEHTRKRKRVANIFSQQNVLAFEPRVQIHLQNLCTQLDLRCEKALQDTSGFNWVAEAGRAVIDCCPQFTYLAFDIIGDLALGSPFGMIEAQKDATPLSPSSTGPGSTNTVPIASTIAESGKTIMSVSSYPSWAHKPLQLLPWRLFGLWNRVNLFRVAATAVDNKQKRVAEGPTNEQATVDVMDKLFQVRNENGTPLSRRELVAEALLMIVAGGDTTSHTLSALCYYLANNPHSQLRLQAELDHQITTGPRDEDDQAVSNVIVTYEQVKNLPYLNACIKEAQRLHSTIGTGLPRVVPPGRTLQVAGEIFTAGSVVSVPSFTVHRSNVWGPDAEKFRPERWMEDGSNGLSKYFVPFSLGPR